MTDRPTVRILAIDDDPGDRRLLEVMLRGTSSYAIELAAVPDFRSGLDQLMIEDFDLLFLDYRIGAETGIGILRKLRELGHAQPVIILTGQGGEDVVVEAMKAGAADYMNKAQMGEESLDRAIVNALEKSRLLQAVEAHRQELTEVNKDLTRRNQEIVNFYQTLSHELKTPLTAAREFLSIVLDGIAGEVNEEQSSYLNIAKESLDQMKVYIDDLIDVARLETGKLRIHKEATDLVALTRRLVHCVEAEAARRGVALSLDLDELLPPMFMDPHRIAQVVNNLVNNALKFTPEGGRIDVSLHRSAQAPDKVLLQVQDTGTGMDLQHVDRVFDRLYQVERNEGPEHKGLGLGLNICQEIVRMHDGDIWVESEKGEGSTFYVLLPLTPVPVEV